MEHSDDLIDTLTTELAALATQVEVWLSDLRQGRNILPTTYLPDVDAAYTLLKQGMGRNSDVLLRKIRVPACPDGPVLVASVDGLADSQMVDQDIIRPLLTTRLPPEQWNEGAVTPIHISTSQTWPDILQKLSSGNTLVFAPHLSHVWVIDTVRYPQRSIQRPITELAVRGAEEAFNEVLLTQRTQIRRRLRSPSLIFHDMTVGQNQQLPVTIAYLEDIANPSLVATVINRVNAIQLGGIAQITTLASLIRDHPRSIFPTIRQTERVDVAHRHLLEGSVLVMMDGDPFVLIAPSPLIDFYRTAMDYSTAWIDASFMRIIRFLGWLMGIYLPALYVALAEINPGTLPGSLYVTMQGSNTGLAFSPIVQIVLMIIVIETLREAALRLPKALSTTIGTVGAIVVGTAVVKAGFVDPQLIVLMTLTALSLFSTPIYELTTSWRILGFILLLAAAVLGLLGMVLVTVAIVAVLTDMRSFGSPYFVPWAPFRASDWPDAIWRLPASDLWRRSTNARPTKTAWREEDAATLDAHLRKAQRRSQ